MPNYSKFEEYLNTQNDSVNLKFSEIESIVGKLPKSAFTYQEWWSNHPSHPLMKVVLKNGWRQRNLDLFLKQVEFSQNNRISEKKNQKHIQNSPIVIKSENNTNHKIESNSSSLKIDDLVFSHTCEISPKLDN